MTYNPAQQTLLLVIYGFLAWAAEVVYFAVREKKFVNRGLLSIPLDLGVGIVFSNSALILPTMGRNYAGMYFIVFANLVITRALLGFLSGRVTRNARWLEAAPNGTGRNILSNAAAAAAILVTYLLLQPLLMVVMELIPPLVLRIFHIAVWALILLDLVAVLAAVRRGRETSGQKRRQGRMEKIAADLSRFVWERLEKAYPGISDEEKRSDIVFARGMNLDKIVWVFLISAFLGDIVETFYCRFVGGVWMSRSSVVFGPFSFVWGIGAVLLTVSLIRLKDKNDRWVLLAGALLGGAFEYACSVFTEIVFGKVFWDYSHMPLNIGGRTNVLFMFFWGILGLIWVKIAYPPLDRLIENFPPVAAKTLTWLIVALMTLNGLFTAAVLVRYNERKVDPEPSGMLEEMIDANYNDDYVENRWQNMKSAEP